MGRPNIKEFYEKQKPEKIEVILPFGMKQLKRQCPFCKSNLFIIDNSVKCNSCSFKKNI